MRNDSLVSAILFAERHSASRMAETSTSKAVIHAFKTVDVIPLNCYDDREYAFLQVWQL